MKKLTRKEYDAALAPMQLELVAMARWLRETRKRLVVLLEGRDTAGKGGTIDAIREYMNPRQCRVVALDKPSDREQTQWYFQRYIDHSPAAGEIALFDRSWYNRPCFEQVIGFATPEHVQMFLNQAPIF